MEISNNNTGNKIAKNEDFQIYDLLLKALSCWYWFVLSVVICGGLAYLYAKSSPHVYMRNASILIKDDKKNSGYQEVAAFEDLGIFKTNTNVNNEIATLVSPTVMEEVVKRLDLNISYLLKDGFRQKELYLQSPVKVSFPDAAEHSFVSFMLELKPDNTAVLSNFTQGGLELQAKDLKVALSDTVLTPVGMVFISPSLYYSSAMFNVPVYVSKSSIKNTANQFLGKLAVALASKETTIVNLSVRDASIQRADDVLGTLIAVYNENWLTDKSLAAVNTSKTINERLSIIGQELGGIDDSIEQFKSKHLLTNVQAAATMVMAESSEYASKIFEINNQLSIIKHIKNYLTDNNKAAELLPANTGVSDLNIQTQIGEYNNLLMKRNKQIANSSEKHPVIIEMNNMLIALRQSILRTVENKTVTLNLQLSALKVQDARTIKRIESSPGQEKHLTSVERQQKIKETLYLYLLQKREENVLSQAITINNTRIINPPSGSDAPIEPKSRNILLAGIVLGLALPLGFIWVKDMLNTTVRSKNDLNILAVPMLGEIPQADKKVTKNSILLVREKHRDMINEAFRVVRTNMDFLRVKSDMKTIMFTSYNPGSGKTFVTLNIAMSFALTGKKTLILDLDLRRASLSKHVSSPKVGISNYLSGMTDDINEITVRNHVHSNLDIIPVGIIPPNPAELLLSPRLTDLLNKLKEEYDSIFIDCTPVDLVTDATIVGKIADLTIFLIREGLLDRRMLPNIEEMYNQKRFNNMAVLLNGSNFVARYGYRRYGKYEYTNG